MEIQDLIVNEICQEAFSFRKTNLVLEGEIEAVEREKPTFHLKYAKTVRNFLMTFNLSGKNTPNDKEIIFYYRYVDKDNYCSFSIKDGMFIRWTLMGKGEIKIQTSYLKVTESNLLSDNFPFVLAVFDDTTTVIFDNKIVLNIDHTPDVTGQLAMSFVSRKDTEYNLTFGDFNISEELVNFQYVLTFPKSSDVYFMQANDFYEQNRNELALIYYNKGLLFGAADDKINNRIGNIYFMIEEYEKAVKHYKAALDAMPDKVEYRINLGRAYSKVGNYDEAQILLENALKTVKDDYDMLNDLADVKLHLDNYDSAVKIFKYILSKEPNNFVALYKLGKAMINNNEVTGGKKYLYQAAKVVYKSDPESAVILLKYSIDRKADLDSVKLLADILISNSDAKDAYELIKKSRIEIEYDDELFEMLINAETELGLTAQIADEFEHYKSTLTPRLKLLKAKYLIDKGDIAGATTLLNEAESENQSELQNLILHVRMKLAIADDPDADADVLVHSSNPALEGYAELQREYGEHLVDRQRFVRAVEILEPLYKHYLKEQDPEANDPQLLYNLALAYTGIGEYPNAVEMYGKIYGRVRTPEIIIGYANALCGMKAYRDGMDIINDNRNILPDDGQMENTLGKLYMGLGNLAEAQRNFYKALDRNGDNEDAALNLAESFYQLNDFESAYKITSQLVKPNCLDRAKSLHLRVQGQLFNSVYCPSCHHEHLIRKGYSAPISCENCGKKM